MPHSASADFFNMNCYRHDNRWLVNFEGALRLQTCDAVNALLMPIMKEPEITLYLNMAQMRELDSAGLGLLVGTHSTTRAKKQKFCLLDPAPLQVKLLHSSRLDSILSIMQGPEAETIRKELERPEYLIDPTALNSKADSDQE